MNYFKPWVGSSYRNSNPRILVIGDSHYCADPCPIPGRCGVRGNLPPERMGRCQNFTQDVTLRYLDSRAGRAEAEGWMGKTYRSFEKMLLGKDDVSVAESMSIWNRIAFYNFVQTAASQEPSNENYTPEDYKRSTPFAAQVMNDLHPDIILVWGTKAYDKMPDENWTPVSDCCVDYTLAGGRVARCVKLTHPSRASFESEHKKIISLVDL